MTRHIRCKSQVRVLSPDHILCDLLIELMIGITQSNLKLPGQSAFSIDRLRRCACSWRCGLLNRWRSFYCVEPASDRSTFYKFDFHCIELLVDSRTRRRIPKTTV